MNLIFRFMLAGLVATGATASAPSPAPDRGDVERLFASVEKAVIAHDLPGVLAAYDPDATALVARKKGEAQGGFSLGDLNVTFRVGSITPRSGGAEAAVLRRVVYSQHGREQIDAQWETVGLRHLSTGWKISSEDERTYQESRSTTLRVELHPDRGTMRGTSTIDVGITNPGENSLLLLLNRGLEVTSVRDAQKRPLKFQRTADSIEIPQSHPLRQGETRSLTIAFEGSLFNEAKEQGYSQVSIAPAGSFASWVTSWYPRIDGTGSKSRGTITFDVPEGITVASSGRLMSSHTAAGRSTEVFAVDRPLDFSFAAAKYFHREETVEGSRIGVYLLSGGDAKADLYIKEGARTLRYERELYGPYPFDGYSVVEIPSEETGTLGGSSEQGMNLFPVGVLPDDAFPLLLLAHEMGHSWWGNLIGSRDGSIMDEGLAQTSAVMTLQKFEGDKAMRRFLTYGVRNYPQSAMMYFLRFAGQKDYALGAAAPGGDAAAAAHDIADTKGMFVYNMLRERIGDEAFHQGLRSVIHDFAGRKAGLSDLRSAWEKASGSDLNLFFQQWFDRTGAPELALDWKSEPAADGFRISGTITQSGELYDVEPEVALLYPGTGEIRKVRISGATTPFSFETAREPYAVVLDPAYKVLRWTAALRNQSLLTSGNGLLSLGRTDEAIATFRDYVAKAPDSLEGRYRLGLALETSNAADAQEQFRMVLDRYGSLGIYEPAVALSQLELGHVADLAGRRADAVAAYQKVLQLPDESESHKDAQASLAAVWVPKAREAGPAKEVLERYTGTYDNGSGIAVVIGLNDQGILTVSQPGRPAGALTWVDGRRFRIPGPSGAIVEFDGASPVTFVDLTYPSGSAHLPRVK